MNLLDQFTIRFSREELEEIIRNFPEQQKLDLKQDLILDNNHLKAEFISEIQKN